MTDRTAIDPVAYDLWLTTPPAREDEDTEALRGALVDARDLLATLREVSVALEALTHGTLTDPALLARYANSLIDRFESDVNWRLLLAKQHDIAELHAEDAAPVEVAPITLRLTKRQVWLLGSLVLAASLENVARYPLMLELGPLLDRIREAQEAAA